jgi:hypothetical protein
MLNKLHNVLYDFTINSDTTKQVYAISDLTTRVSTYASVKNMTLLCNSYTISNNETPEEIAFKIYGDQNLHWTIIYINGITNLLTDWPLNAMTLAKYCEDKYSNVNAIHHYKVLSNGIVGTPNDLQFLTDKFGSDNIVAITNLDFETEENEKKALIQVIKPEYISGFVTNFMDNLAK